MYIIALNDQSVQLCNASVFVRMHGWMYACMYINDTERLAIQDSYIKEREGAYLNYKY